MEHITVIISNVILPLIFFLHIMVNIITICLTVTKYKLGLNSHLRTRTCIESVCRVPNCPRNIL